MRHVTAALVAIVLFSLRIGSIAAMAQPPDSQPTPKPLSRELERMIAAMPPGARATVRHMLETDPTMRHRAESSESRMAKKRLHWTRETVLRKIAEVFPGSDSARVLDMLEGAAPAHFPDWGKYRIQLSIIKLCDETSGFSALPHNVNAAKLDYRDVLAWAEEPRAMSPPLDAGEAEREEAGDRDLEEYLRWIGVERKEKG